MDAWRRRSGRGGPGRGFASTFLLLFASVDVGLRLWEALRAGFGMTCSGTAEGGVYTCCLRGGGLSKVLKVPWESKKVLAERGGREGIGKGVLLAVRAGIFTDVTEELASGWQSCIELLG